MEQVSQPLEDAEGSGKQEPAIGIASPNIQRHWAEIIGGTCVNSAPESRAMMRPPLNKPKRAMNGKRIDHGRSPNTSNCPRSARRALEGEQSDCDSYSSVSYTGRLCWSAPAVSTPITVRVVVMVLVASTWRDGGLAAGTSIALKRTVLKGGSRPSVCPNVLCLASKLGAVVAGERNCSPWALHLAVLCHCQVHSRT